MVGQTYPPSTVLGDTLNTCLFFVLAMSTRVCENGSSFSTFYETFTVENFVVKPLNLSYDQTNQENLNPLCDTSED